MITSGQGPGPRTAAFVRFVSRYGVQIWVLALLIGVFSTYRTVRLFQALRGDIEELLPRDAPSVKALESLRARFPGLQYLGVVVDVGDAKNLPAGERFLDDLQAKIRAYPPDLVRDVRTGVQEQRAFIEKHAPLFIDLPDLKEIRRRIEARKEWEASHAMGASFDDDEEPAPSVDMSDLEAKYRNRAGREGAAGTGRYSSADLHLTMLFVEVGGVDTGADKAHRLLDRVQADVRSLGGPAAYSPGMRLGYASDVAVAVEEMDALQADLSISSILVVLAVMAVIVLYYQWWQSVLVLFPPLLLATTYAFALSSLPPIGVDALNSNTAFLGSIIVGNGVNVGLILVARYREERRRGASVDDALVLAVWGARLGTLVASLAAGMSYASLAVTEFRGFRQFGYIGGLGMVASWSTAFVLMPSLLRWVDRDDRSTAKAAQDPRGSIFDRMMSSLATWIERVPVPIVVVSLLLSVTSAVAVSRFSTAQIEYDFSKLRRFDTHQVGEGYWGRKMDALLGHFLTPTMIMTSSPEQTAVLEGRVREAVANGPLRAYVATVVTARDVLPVDQEAKIAEVEAIKTQLTPKVREQIPADKREQLERFLGGDKLAPISFADLPPSLTVGLRERDGSYGKSILVFPRHDAELWRASAMMEYVDTLRSIAGAEAHVHPAGPTAKAAPGPTSQAEVAGPLPVTTDIVRSIMRDAPLASAASLIGVVVVTVVALRAGTTSWYVLLSLLVGVLWLGGATMGLGIRINFANFIAFPITLGIGIDYAVNVMTRYAQDGERDVASAVRSTGAAVVLCSLTTIIGYSSLLLAKNRALFLFGLLAVLGEFACLGAAVVASPAALLLLQRRRRAAR